MLQQSEVCGKFSLLTSVYLVDVTSLNVETGGIMSAAGSDRPGIIKGNLPTGCYGAGGGYASEGGIGRDLSISLKPYGSLYLPREFGTDGCAGKRPGGTAGGVFFITLGDAFHLDGTLTARGQDGTSGSLSGGASGGSILLQTERFTGNGVLDVSGGQGQDQQAGGGSGGRLAVYIKSRSRFFGRHRANGGRAGDARRDLSRVSGGPGTVYIHELRRQFPYDQLLLDNNNRPLSHYITLNETKDSYEFDEVHLTQKASLHMIQNGKPLNLTIHKILGDGTGLVHVHANQLLTAEVKEVRRTITRAQANFKLDVDSSALMSTVVHMIGRGTVAFAWRGRLINVLHLHLAYGRKAIIGVEAHTGTIQNNRFISSETEGTFHFATLEFGSKSQVDYPSPHGLHFTAGLLVRNLLNVVSSCSM